MKKGIFSVLLSICAVISYANHIVGGEMTYKYKEPGITPNSSIYIITLKLFRDQHTTGAPMPTEAFIGIFNNDNNDQYPGPNQPYNVFKSSEEMIPINPFPPCLTGSPDLDYHVGYFVLEVELPLNTDGYTATYQTCCRVYPMINVFNSAGGSGTGSTYSCTIPPFIDNSPIFTTALDLICANRQFTLNFNAIDADKDSLIYSFCSAYDGGSAQNATNINPSAPPYKPVIYLTGYSFFKPMGDNVTIDSKTGVISGIAPGAGEYIVAVQVLSFKNGVFTGEHRKDFIINVGDCDFAGAQLDPKPVTCNGFSVSFSNSNTSPLNQTFSWEFGDPASGEANFSTLVNPTHQYSDTGVYSYKLIVNKGHSCADSSKQTVKVYPGFFPGFKTSGQCKQFPVQFIDTTISQYAAVSSWSWNFGDPGTLNDTSHVQKPVYTYAASGNYDVSFIVSNSKGCIDTIQSTISIQDKPDFNVSNDTMICVLDTMQLHTNGIGTTFWTPNYNISNQNSLDPLVSPDIPTTYHAAFTDAFGCPGKDSVFVNVKKVVTINAGKDTAICQGDEIQINTTSDALTYSWDPATSLISDTSKSPLVTPLVTTTYTVTGNFGRCQAKDQITIKVTPYPAAKAGTDTMICVGETVQLQATGGTFYTWSPPIYLNNANISNPVAIPANSTTYTVTVLDTLGCPKPAEDSLTLIVQQVFADAGPRDTSIVLKQSLQLNASGGQTYVWTPSTGLTSTTIPNPVARLTDNQQYVVLVTTSAGCSATDTINVTVYKIDQGIYVPNAFTPNNDGLNDQFRAIPIGMKSIKYFRIYNRWGQLLFSTNQAKKGWDGTYKGQAQDAAVYVWVVEGTDYLDQKITQKGTVVLIR